MSGYLLDTNVVSELRKGKRADPKVQTWFQKIKEGEAFLSVLALGEIRSGIERIRQTDPPQAKALDRWLKGLEEAYSEHFIPVTTAIADRWGHLNALSPVSVIDGLMAATALEEDLTLVTRNVHDVARKGVKVINPFDEPEG